MNRLDLENPAYALHPLKAEFIDKDMERSYRSHVEVTTARHLALALTVWATLLLVFAGLDLADLGFGAPFIILLAMRAVQVVLLLLLAWWVTRLPALATNGWPVTILEIIGFPLYFVLLFLRPDTYALIVGVILILLISMYLFIPNRVVLTNLTAVAGIAGTLLAAGLLGQPAAEILVLVPVLLLPAITGYVAARRLQIVQRYEFALLQEGLRRNEQLLAEIQRREALELELQRQATTDPLTGLYNRRQYEALFNRERERCQRQGSSIVIGIIDLDHFKQINDTFGHQVGDLVLCHVAEVLQEPLRQTDVLGRFGGEEFILILPDTSIDLARNVVERLRRTLEETPMLYDGGMLKITATFAITEVKPGDKNIAGIIRRADEALYLGKTAGRNQVVVANRATATRH